MIKLIAILIVTLIYAITVGLSFLFCAGIIWLICWAFGLMFSWKAAFGLWLVLLLVSGFFKTNVRIGK